MARFRYSLQSILNIKEKLEVQERQAFAAAQVRLSTEEEKLAALKERMRENDEKAQELLNGPLDLMAIQENKAMQIALDNYIVTQQGEVQRAERNLENARTRMTEVRTERRTYETLREQAFQEFLQEENKAEGRVVDELVSYTFGQKQKG